MNEDCLKLTNYFGERQRAGGTFVADTQLDLFGRREIATSVLLRGAEGFGLKHHLRTNRLLTLSEDLPIVSIAVDTRPKIEALLDDLQAIKRPKPRPVRLLAADRRVYLRRLTITGHTEATAMRLAETADHPGR